MKLYERFRSRLLVGQTHAVDPVRAKGINDPGSSQSSRWECGWSACAIGNRLSVKHEEFHQCFDIAHSRQTESTVDDFGRIHKTGGGSAKCTDSQCRLNPIRHGNLRDINLLCSSTAPDSNAFANDTKIRGLPSSVKKLFGGKADGHLQEKCRT